MSKEQALRKHAPRPSITSGAGPSLFTLLNAPTTASVDTVSKMDQQELGVPQKNLKSASRAAAVPKQQQPQQPRDVPAKRRTESSAHEKPRKATAPNPPPMLVLSQPSAAKAHKIAVASQPRAVQVSVRPVNHYGDEWVSDGMYMICVLWISKAVGRANCCGMLCRHDTEQCVC